MRTKAESCGSCLPFLLGRADQNLVDVDVRRLCHRVDDSGSDSLVPKTPPSR